MAYCLPKKLTWLFLGTGKLGIITLPKFSPNLNCTNNCQVISGISLKTMAAGEVKAIAIFPLGSCMDYGPLKKIVLFLFATAKPSNSIK